MRAVTRYITCRVAGLSQEERGDGGGLDSARTQWRAPLFRELLEIRRALELSVQTYQKFAVQT